MIDAAAWKVTSIDESAIYRIQINGLDNQMRDYVDGVLSDWNTAGEGFSPKGEVVIFSKQFDNPDAWENWLKSFKKFDLRFLDREGKIKKKVKGSEPIITVDKKQRVCRKCGTAGHNARTCWEFNRKNK